MARLIGNTRSRINWLLWTAIAIIVAILGAATAWLSSFLGPIV